jgi:phosphoribosylformylglycinamidine synthase II
VFARIEVAMQPDFTDPHANNALERLGLVNPALRRKVRWARSVDVFWLDIPLAREELIGAISEIYWDKVLQWVFTGNLIPSAAGKHGGIQDLMEAAPHRPGKFYALERRFRPGVTDNVARTSLEAFEIVAGKKLPDARAASGGLLVLEGPELTDEDLATIAREILCNELIETWTVYNESELSKSDRFHQERVKRDLPKVNMRTSLEVQLHPISTQSDAALDSLSKSNLWALTLEEMLAIKEHFGSYREKERRAKLGLGEPTDVEMEVIAQTWSEHCKHKLFAAEIDYKDFERQPTAPEIPSKIVSLFKTTISETTKEIPKHWLLSVFSDNAGIIAFDEEDALCIKVETHNSPSALDPYGGALTGIVGVNRDILGCGLGARPIFNTDVFCLAVPDYAKPLPERLLHPRRILDGVRRGVEHGGNKSGIPTINGALVFDDRYLGKPLIYCGTGGFMPREIAGRACETKEVRPGDRVVMVGGRIGKDGIHGATFSSLALDEASPSSAVQLGDPITQKRVADFLLEARDRGLYRAVTDNGAGGLSSSVGEMATLSGGARIDVSLAKVKYPGLKPFELVVSESQERMTLAVPPENMPEFARLADRRGVEVSDLGEFTESGTFDVMMGNQLVSSLRLDFLHDGNPRIKLQAEWRGRPPLPKKSPQEAIQTNGAQTLLDLLGRPNIASKEWLIRQYDHEVQGTSVIKPLHTVAAGTPHAVSGPNDAGVIKPKLESVLGVAVGCGINPKLSDWDPYIMAQSAVDEAVRNVLAVGAEYGEAKSVLALVDNFCWPDPVSDTGKAAALVRACFGMRAAAKELSAPFVSGKDSMKNDYKGRLGGEEIKISVPPTLLVTAVARVNDVRWTRTADFKHPGDVIYVLGGRALGLVGSELHSMRRERGIETLPGDTEPRLAKPDWEEARRTYAWMGGAIGKEQGKMRSLHDVADGGMLVTLAESMLARGLGAVIQLPNATDASFNPWEYCFGEGFHSFVTSCTEADTSVLENEWTALRVPFRKLGHITGSDKLEVKWNIGSQPTYWSVDIKSIRAAWKKEGYWE